MRRFSNHIRTALLGAISVGVLTACDAAEVVLWPFIEDGEQEVAIIEPRDPSTLPPPPLEPVNPLDPDAGNSDDVEEVVETVPNPSGNAGAPDEGTPFIEEEENEEIVITEPEPVPVDPSTEEGGANDGENSGETDVAEGDTGEPEPVVPEPTFAYYPAGSLQPSSGTGSPDLTVFVPDMAFPIEVAASYPQSQVYRYGGGIKGGDQCDPRNFEAAWRDNYCESRSRNSSTPFCPNTGVHLGQDIRVGTPEGCREERSTPARERARYAVVAVEDGIISNVGSYSVNVRASGRIYRYMHMNMQNLKVGMGDPVKKGDVIGYVSNDFGGTPTTLHLHFEIKVNTAEHGWQYVPPYTSLLAAYQRRENNLGTVVDDVVEVATTP